MLAHALYRARRFAESVAYLAQARAVLAAAPARQFADVGPRLTFLLAADYAFLNRNRESISLLEARAEGQAAAACPPTSSRLACSSRSIILPKVSLPKASQTLISLDRTDFWLEQHMGLEWLLNHNIGELLIQLELGNPDVALVRLRAIERRLHEQFPGRRGHRRARPLPPSAGPTTPWCATWSWCTKSSTTRPWPLPLASPAA